MTLSLWLQWGLLVGNAALVAAAAVCSWARPQARPWAFAVGVLAGSHGIYYALFLWQPRILAPEQTMLFSIALRYMVVFMAAFLLMLSARRVSWRR